MASNEPKWPGEDFQQLYVSLHVFNALQRCITKGSVPK